MKRQHFVNLAILVAAALAGYAAYRLGLHRAHWRETICLALGADIFVSTAIFLNLLRSHAPGAAVFKAVGLAVFFAVVMVLARVGASALAYGVRYAIANPGVAAAWMIVVVGLLGAFARAAGFGPGGRRMPQGSLSAADEAP